MCTAAVYRTRSFYFGRNLDLEYSYHETITITPRNYPFRFRLVRDLPSHYAMIGMAHVADGTPLYYEATNEKGLSMAGLNFPGYAVYRPFAEGRDNVMTFELIPWILGQCADLSQVRALLDRMNVTEGDFSDSLPAATLHWMISDREGSLTLESVGEGLKVYDNPVEVLTNSPPFDYQMTNLRNYLNLSPEVPVNRFCREPVLTPFSQGMGAVGLPGDLSSASRFVRASFVKLNSRSGSSEEESVSQFFHILGSVAQQRGCVDLGNGKYDVTVYSSCCNGDTGTYYYTTYENSRITKVEMGREDLDSQKLISYPMLEKPSIQAQN